MALITFMGFRDRETRAARSEIPARSHMKNIKD